jgi:hypothetical protein
LALAFDMLCALRVLVLLAHELSPLRGRKVLSAIIIHAKDASVWRVEHPLFDIPAPGSIGANIQRRFPNNPDTFAHTPCHNPLHTSKQNQTLKSTKLLRAPCV